ncbi:MAG: hypothetical protein ACREHD_12280 [Pirellulales bacterium]
MRNDLDVTCLVCGYPHLSEPPYDESGCASFEICPSCGTEFGYDDATKPIEALRQEWLDGGAPWWSKDRRPPLGWSGTKQLEDAGLLHPRT